MSQPPPLPPQHVMAPSLIAPGILVLAGVLLMGLVGVLEQRWMAGEVWTDALFTPDKVLGLEGAVPVKARRLPPNALPQDDPFAQVMRQLEGMEGAEALAPLLQTEHVLMLDLPQETLQGLLASGRLPEPGQPEVLAGPLARYGQFTFDRTDFRVVGRLKPTVSGFVFAYLLPAHSAHAPFFTEEAGGTQGTLLADGFARIEEVVAWLEEEEARQSEADPLPPSTEAGEVAPAPDPADSSETYVEMETTDASPDAQPPARTELLGGQLPTRGLYAFGVFLGLVLVAVGGAVFHYRFFQRWAPAAPEVFQGALREILNHRRLFVGMHVLLYGLFFGTMLMGMNAPLMNYWMTHYIGAMFRDGNLSYIGEAYASGNIAWAALATFQNNYIVQTLLLTFVISIPPVALGVLKTALSFSLVGFAMAPLWVGTASGMTFHSITMALELEAYIVACFAVVAWARRLLGMLGDQLKYEVITGVMLLLAALIMTLMLGLHPYFSALLAGTAWSIRLLRVAVERDMPQVAASVRMLVGAAVLTGVMLVIAAIYEATTLILLKPIM